MPITAAICQRQSLTIPILLTFHVILIPSITTIMITVTTIATRIVMITTIMIQGIAISWIEFSCSLQQIPRATPLWGQQSAGGCRSGGSGPSP